MVNLETLANKLVRTVSTVLNIESFALSRRRDAGIFRGQERYRPECGNFMSCGCRGTIRSCSG
jgi:hypothetical protein